MRKIISQTEASARTYLSAFGFDADQVELLIETGKRDLDKLLTRLEVLLEHDTPSREELDGALHALKGLLFHLGNHALAERIENTRTHRDDAEYASEIAALLA